LQNVWIVVLAVVGGAHDGSIEIGLWVVTGLLTFMTIEKIFPENSDEDPEDENAEDVISTVCIFVIFKVLFLTVNRHLCVIFIIKKLWLSYFSYRFLIKHMHIPGESE